MPPQVASPRAETRPRADPGRRRCLSADSARTAADRVKRLHLELGGKAPVVVFDDADLDAVIDNLKTFSYYNSGQDCTAA